MVASAAGWAVTSPFSSGGRPSKTPFNETVIVSPVGAAAGAGAEGAATTGWGLAAGVAEGGVEGVFFSSEPFPKRFFINPSI